MGAEIRRTSTLNEKIAYRLNIDDSLRKLRGRLRMRVYRLAQRTNAFGHPSYTDVMTDREIVKVLGENSVDDDATAIP